MAPFRRSTRRGMLVGAAVASSRANQRAAAQAQQAAQAAQAQQPSQAISTDDNIEQIKKLAELRDQGILTDAEFEAKKKQLLGL